MFAATNDASKSSKGNFSVSANLRLRRELMNRTVHGVYDFCRRVLIVVPRCTAFTSLEVERSCMNALNVFAFHVSTINYMEKFKVSVPSISLGSIYFTISVDTCERSYLASWSLIIFCRSPDLEKEAGVADQTETDASEKHPLSPVIMATLIKRRRDGNDVPGRRRFKSGRVRSRLLDWTKELECAKFGVNATLATAKAYTKQQAETLYRR
ncbi:hypothetical protein ALC62_04580 [Cyphomyrmex costatus]|uniref:Uncharacterized protein n=1 Tax=Cyphomyrmex costatus TaxID=456900 RepID=A0A195CWR1_9HYME|nr:hypothetical protein ALC62_04580 [Cyphomyrmex costatus]